MRALLLFVAATAIAQTPPAWTEHFPAASPPVRENAAMEYDSARGQVVLFGGAGDPTVGFGPQGSVSLNDTWVWDGTNWTQKLPQNSPAPRRGFAMAYDSLHGQVVLFGGVGAAPTATMFNDTWVWDGTNWIQQVPQTNPPGRSGHAMAYDATNRQVLLFGGGNGNSSPLGDTWVWDGSDWTQNSPQTSPPARSNHAMAYDGTEIVLFGGDTQGGVGQNDTWTWDGSNWTSKSSQTSPAARSSELMVNASALGQVVLFGGQDNHNQELNDTWLWDDTKWMQQSPQNNPSVRIGEAMAYDSGHGQVVLFGGATGGTGQLLSDTWAYGAGPLPGPPPSITAVVSASAFGGFANVAPGSWIEIYGSNLTTGTRGWTGADFNGNNAPIKLDDVSVSIGGQAAFVDYISQTQVDALLPSNISTGGSLALTLTNTNGTSTPVSLTVNATEPGLLAPESFKVGANQYVVAQFVDGTYVLPTGAIAGITSRPAKPGETIIIYGIGFGSVTPDVSAGEIVTQENQLNASLEISFGTALTQLRYWGLAPNLVGVYQFNIVVPDVLDNDLVPMTFKLGGVAGMQTLFTAVHR